jgi:hypothetical protein
MFGYLAPLKSELKMREFEVYNAYYCAICHAVKRRYGELPRLMLSYDAVLIAILAEELSAEKKEPSFSTFRCFNNPLKKRNETAISEGIDYAADVMVFLGWLSLRDRKIDRDAGNLCQHLITITGETFIRRAGHKASGRLGEKSRILNACYDEQRVLESAQEESLDKAADPTGRMMAELLDFPNAGIHPGALDLRKLGYHLGRYIYIIDAIDDLEKDKGSGAYNPLILRHESPDALKTAVLLDLARVCELTDKLDLVNNKDIIYNIIYLGLRAKLDEVTARIGTQEVKTKIKV